MAGVRDWNNAVSEGTILAGSLRSAAVTLSTTAQALSSTSIPILWVIIENVGTVNVYIGGSSVANSGSSRGILIRPNGETPPLSINDLSQVFAIAASGTPDILYIAGIYPA